MFNAHN